MKEKLYVGPLRRSLRRFISNENPDYEIEEKDAFPLRYLIGKSIDKFVDNILPRMDTPDEQEALTIATRAMVQKYVGNIHWDIQDAMMTCGSPIERILLAALIVIIAKEGIGLYLKQDYYEQTWPIEFGKHPARTRTSTLTITPQAQLGEYRVDFLLVHENIETEYPKEAQEELSEDTIAIIKPELGVHTRIQKDLIIECDGHDFHEKTKQQATRDKRRDRILQSLGYKVFRFTGSEIYNDAMGCAFEVINSFDTDIGIREPINPE